MQLIKIFWRPPRCLSMYGFLGFVAVHGFIEAGQVVDRS